jgi:hypothetical protein
MTIRPTDDSPHNDSANFSENSSQVSDDSFQLKTKYILVVLI